MSYSYEGYMFHYMVKDGLTFLCLTDSAMDRRTAFAFLFSIQEGVLDKFSEDELYSSHALSLNKEFAGFLANQMDYFSHNPAEERLNQVKEKLDNTKKKINANIERLLSREERVELLVGKAGNTTEQAHQFSQRGKQMQWTVLKKNTKYLAFLAILAMVILWLVMSLFCGLSMQRC